jgi:hypothetical protein
MLPFTFYKVSLLKILYIFQDLLSHSILILQIIPEVLSAIWRFCRSVVLPFGRSAVLPFCRSAVLATHILASTIFLSDLLN